MWHLVRLFLARQGRLTKCPQTDFVFILSSSLVIYAAVAAPAIDDPLTDAALCRPGYFYKRRVITEPALHPSTMSEIARSRPTSAHEDDSTTMAPTPNLNLNEKNITPNATVEEEDVEKGDSALKPAVNK